MSLKQASSTEALSMGGLAFILMIALVFLLYLEDGVSDE
jgi:hypothetical protein